MSAEAALKIADEQELDLVKISPNATPPVCKIMDYSKFRFEQTRPRRKRKPRKISVSSKSRKFVCLPV